MIILKDQDFEMEQTKELPFFDLKMPSIINKGKDNERIEMKIVGYGIPFHDCIKKIVFHRLSFEDKTYSISEYLINYSKEVEKISSLIQYKEKEKKKKGEEDEEENVDEIEKDE